jgi:O-antigen ligase
MMRKTNRAVLQFVAFAFFLIGFLCANEIWGLSSGFIGFAIRGLNTILRDRTAQWIVLAWLTFYLIAFSTFDFRASADYKWWWVGNPILWQFAFVGLAVFGFAFDHSAAADYTMVLVIFGTLGFGKAVSMWVGWKKRGRVQRGIWLIGFLVSVLTASVFWHPERMAEFRYHGISRWSGPWDNPNLFGLLMGSSFVLSLGGSIRGWRRPLLPILRLTGTLLCSVAMLLTSCGIFNSFSRGAWLGAIIGVAYLLCFKTRMSKATTPASLFSSRNWRFLVVILFALTALGFWQFRFIEWQPARRVFSAVNVNDFSWRNRVVAWQGALRMMADRPWFGFGWGQAEATYEKEYLPRQLENGAALQMNDYFMLGISAGVPALVCFLMYVGLSFRRNPRLIIGSRKVLDCENGRVSVFDDLVWLQATCRAGAMVLLVGFFVDGGLFKLATGSVFWILLELGRMDIYKGNEVAQKVEIPLAVVQKSSSNFAEHEFGDFAGSVARGFDLPKQRNRREIWIRRVAWILGIAAVSESAILVATPFLGVNNTTLVISRRYLVPHSTVTDLNLLATNVDWSSRKLRPLLQHSDLANYNRQLINWKLDDEIYRDYVLNPLIDPQRDGGLNWRRKLWEYFYLPVRKEHDPTAAARIVLKFLNERIVIVPLGSATIEEMWREKRADDSGVQALEVAAFRSVGIPARLNKSGRAELFSEGKWQDLLEYTQPASEAEGM